MRRLNTDGRGILLGEFKGDDKIVVWTSKYQYYITGFNVGQHFPDETVRVERYVAGKVYSLCYFDKEQGYYYMKRFQLEASERMQSFLEDDATMTFIALTDRSGATLVVTYKGAHASRPADEVDVDSFIGIKSHRAKGKRITTYDVDTLSFIEPELPDEPEEVEDADTLEPEVDAMDVMDMGDAMNVVAKMEHSDADYVQEPITKEQEEQAIVLNPEQLNLF